MSVILPFAQRFVHRGLKDFHSCQTQKFHGLKLWHEQAQEWEWGTCYRQEEFFGKRTTMLQGLDGETLMQLAFSIG